MADEEFDIDDIERRMKNSVSILQKEFGGLRTGRAAISLLEPITVDAYGAQTPMAQVGTISVPEPRMLSVQVWDTSLVSAVEKAIRNSSLGLNPIVEGSLLRIPIPELNEERRQELSKVAGQYSEHARIAVRNVRRDGMDKLKHLEKDGGMSQDEEKLWSEEVQSLTDQAIKEIDDALATKEKEIMQV